MSSKQYDKKNMEKIRKRTEDLLKSLPKPTTLDCVATDKLPPCPAMKIP